MLLFAFIRAASLLKLVSDFVQSSLSESPLLMYDMAVSSESHSLLFTEAIALVSL